MPRLTVRNLTNGPLSISSHINLKSGETKHFDLTVDVIERLQADKLQIAADKGAISYTTSFDPNANDNAEGTVVAELPGGSVASQVKITAADTAADFLLTKLVAGANVTITQLNPGGFEQARIDATSTGSSSLLWGDDSVQGTTTTRYLTPGYDDGTAEVTPTQFRLPRPGILRNFRVRHNVPAGNGNNIVYTLRVNGVATALAVSLSSNTADASNLVNAIAVNAGDLVDIEVTKAASVGASPNNIIGSMEFAA